MWQGALRHPDDQVRAGIVDEIETGQSIAVELLYSDQVGLQRTISRFSLVPAGDTWIASLNRHWYLDWEGPRPEDLSLTAAEVILRDREAVAQRRESRERVSADTDDRGSVGAGGAPSEAGGGNPTEP